MGLAFAVPDGPEVVESTDPVASSAASSDAAPQDYGLAMAAGWAAFQGGDWEGAMRYYRRAEALSEGAFEARLGIAWTLQRQGERKSARAVFEQLALERPEDPAVQDGLALTEPPPRVAVEPGFGLSFQLFGTGASREVGGGADADVVLRIVDRVWIRGTYRYADFGSERTGNGSGFMGGQNMTRRLDQHQVHAGLGVFWPRVGFAGHYAFADFSLGEAHQLHVPGSTLRISTWGDLMVEGSATFSEQPVVGRTALAYRLPAAKWLDLTPAGGLQFDRGDVLPTGYLGLRFHGKPGSIAVGGKYGEERQPVYVGLATIYSQRSPVRGGGWFVASAWLPRGFSLTASYALDSLDLLLESGEVDPVLNHAVSLGVAWASDWKVRP